MAEQPSALVTLTVYEPADETTIDCVVAPVDQRFPAAEDDDSVIVLPAQKVDGPLMVGVAGGRLSVTAKATEVAEQPPGSVTVTVYEPAVETTMDWAVSPVDQRFPVVADDVSVMVVPVQKELGPLIVGVVRTGVADTANGSEVAEQPPGSVTVTV